MWYVRVTYGPAYISELISAVKPPEVTEMVFTTISMS